MNTDGKPDLHASASTRLLLKDETQQIIGCAFEVLNEIGSGFHEKIYENALAVALKQAGVAFDQQKRFPVKFRGSDVGEFVPDLIAFDAVIVEAKVIDRITDHERGQLLNYLRITKLRVGLILNFRHSRLEWERVVL
jgi:GxxExxY protein